MPSNLHKINRIYVEITQLLQGLLASCYILMLFADKCMFCFFVCFSSFLITVSCDRLILLITFFLIAAWRCYQHSSSEFGPHDYDNYQERFPCHRLQRKPPVSDHGMHHGMCVTHGPWCMSGLLTRGGGENVPSIPGACATRNFTYLSGRPMHVI